MISRSLLVAGGLAVIVSVNAFPGLDFPDTGLQSFVSWSEDTDALDRSRRDAEDCADDDYKCKKRADKAKARADKAAARESALAVKAAQKTKAREAKTADKAKKLAAKAAIVATKKAAKQAQRQAKTDQRAAKVEAKEAAREAKAEAKADAIKEKAEGKVNSRLAYKKIRKSDVCVAGAVTFMSMMDMGGVASGTAMVTKPMDAPNNAGWYVLVDPPKRHSASSVTSSNGMLSFSTYPAVIASGFTSWCEVGQGSGWGPDMAMTYTTDMAITYTGATTSAALWSFYYCYEPLGDSDDEELMC